MTIFSRKYRVPWADTDAAKVVHFSNYFRYCEKVEEEFFNSLGLDFKEVSEKYNIWFPRVSASCKYNWPLRFNQKFRVDLDDLIIGDKSIKFIYKIWNLDENKLSAECEITVVTASIDLGEAITIPSELREALMRRIKSMQDRKYRGRIEESRRVIRRMLEMAYDTYLAEEKRLGDSWRERSWDDIFNHLMEEIDEIIKTRGRDERFHDCLDACSLAAILAAKLVIST